MVNVDRVEIIMTELAKCNPAHFTDNGKNIEAVYLPSESIGVVLCHAAAMRLDMQKMKSEIERLKTLEPLAI